jgi:RimJ/RimL family protein N-acetyltransferase
MVTDPKDVLAMAEWLKDQQSMVLRSACKRGSEMLRDYAAVLPELTRLREEHARLTAERDEARQIVADVNNEVVGSHGYFNRPPLHGAGPALCVEAIWKLKSSSNAYFNALTAERAKVRELREWLKLPRTSFGSTEYQDGAADSFELFGRKIDALGLTGDAPRAGQTQEQP